MSCDSRQSKIEQQHERFSQMAIVLYGTALKSVGSTDPFVLKATGEPNALIADNPGKPPST
jgi:hypothetical protein